MAKGDKTISLREQRELLKLIEDIEAYFTPGIEDGQGETEEERKALSIPHDDILHELGDSKDLMQRYCGSCFILNANRRIKAILSG